MVVVAVDIELPVPRTSENSGRAAQHVVSANNGVVFGFLRQIRWIFGGRSVLDQNGVVRIDGAARDPLAKHVGSSARVALALRESRMSR